MRRGGTRVTQLRGPSRIDYLARRTRGAARPLLAVIMMGH
ncbi:unnamed protein product [Mycetohabitans rhizoxinica HKI 454]|uniref:Uncharacterized protein n=1 Tax=Mycetohabitans rhizoxinica (strain DSM 19002 / CIP 109453 / HKI 454) TaxID=882378 RepID=E5ATD0_MYCRK|nr:unnamed protein product [Mycetohabitans rhizoxinica HKI 454]